MQTKIKKYIENKNLMFKEISENEFLIIEKKEFEEQKFSENKHLHDFIEFIQNQNISLSPIADEKFLTLKVKINKK